MFPHRAFEALEPKEGIAKVVAAQGFVRLKSGDYAAAYADYSEALAIARQVGDQHLAIPLLPGVAASAFQLGNRSEALGLAIAVCDEAAQSHNANLAVWALDLVADVAADTSPESATRLAGASGRLREEAGGGMLAESLGLTDARTIAASLVTPEDLDRAWAEGRSLSLEEAIAHAHSLLAPD